MKKLIVAATAAAAISLGSCSTITPGQVTTITQALLGEATVIAETVCAAVPTATALITLLNAGVAAEASALATAFCQAIQSAVPVSSAASGALKSGRRYKVYVCVPGSKICGYKL